MSEVNGNIFPNGNEYEPELEKFCDENLGFDFIQFLYLPFLDDEYKLLNFPIIFDNPISNLKNENRNENVDENDNKNISDEDYYKLKNSFNYF